jgi:hypothetical protein
MLHFCLQVAPLRLGFGLADAEHLTRGDIKLSNPLAPIDTSVTFVLWFDIILKLRTASLRHGVVCDDWRFLAARYFGSAEAWADVLTAYPFAWHFACGEPAPKCTQAPSPSEIAVGPSTLLGLLRLVRLVYAAHALRARVCARCSRNGAAQRRARHAHHSLLLVLALHVSVCARMWCAAVFDFSARTWVGSYASAADLAAPAEWEAGVTAADIARRAGWYVVSLRELVLEVVGAAEPAAANTLERVVRTILLLCGAALGALVVAHAVAFVGRAHAVESQIANRTRRMSQIFGAGAVPGVGATPVPAQLKRALDEHWQRSIGAIECCAPTLPCAATPNRLPSPTLATCRLPSHLVLPCPRAHPVLSLHPVAYSLPRAPVRPCARFVGHHATILPRASYFARTVHWQGCANGGRGGALAP